MKTTQIAGSWDLEKVAMNLMMRPARTEQGKRVQAAVLARVEIAIAIEKALKS